FQLYQTLPSFSRSAYPPSRTLTPRLKKRSPHGVASQEAPASVVNDQRVDGAAAKSAHAHALRVGSPAASASSAARRAVAALPRCPRRSSRPLGRLTLASGARAADRQTIHPQGRLADANGHALAVLAAGADPVVETQIVADHRHFGQSIRSVAD